MEEETEQIKAMVSGWGGGAEGKRGGKKKVGVDRLREKEKRVGNAKLVQE